MKPRGRHKKHRFVQAYPDIRHFSPRGKPGRPDEIDVTMDEFETLRLTDYIGLKQIAAAKEMHISQQTFSRIIRSARRKVIDAFVNGKTIKFHGGHYVIRKQSTFTPGEA